VVVYTYQEVGASQGGDDLSIGARKGNQAHGSFRHVKSGVGLPTPVRDYSSMLMTSSAGPSGHFRIGQVSRITGIPPETLRSWEARNKAVCPARSPGGFRLYSVDEIERLKLIRALTELGNPVGTIADLDTRSLRERLTSGGSRLSDAQLKAIAADEALPESVRKLSKAIQELRVVAGSEEGKGQPPAFTASLMELESLLAVLWDVRGSIGS
jgi:DNA-binding transcriptional MerR regulator